jgi:hypothetical protein
MAKMSFIAQVTFDLHINFKTRLGNVNMATENWYNEIKNIDPRVPIEQEFKQKPIGHFTAGKPWQNFTNKMTFSCVEKHKEAGNFVCQGRTGRLLLRGQL